MISSCLLERLRHFLILNSDIKDSLKKFSFLFCQAKMVFAIVWFLDHFTLEYVPSVNNVGIVTFVNHLHAWVKMPKTVLIFFKLAILTSNNVVWVSFSAILLDGI